jgi:hypothetical protein
MGTRFTSAADALTWALQQGYGNLAWTELYAKIFNEAMHKNIGQCASFLEFPDGSKLPADEQSLFRLKDKLLSGICS